MAQLMLSETEFAGFPFLDAGFDRDRALVAVACVRWRRLTGRDDASPDDLRRMLVPEIAARVRHLDLDLLVSSFSLDGSAHRRIRTALTTIAVTVAEWAPLLAVPWRYRGLDPTRGAIGASTFAWPQHTFLSHRAFTSDEELVEQIVHELCHGWLYLLEELSPLEHPGCTRQVILPSGTAERGVSELLGAIHVVVNLRRLWQRLRTSESLREARLTHLDAYLAQALRLLPDTYPCMTAEGSLLAARLGGISL